MTQTSWMSHLFYDKRKVAIALTLFVCVLHMAVRIHDLDRASFWCDESLTWSMSNWSSEVVISSILDVHPPLYFFLIGLWKDFVGSSEFSLRLISVVFSALTLLVILLHADSLNQKRDPWLFVVVSLLICLSPYEIHLSRLARSFTMLMFMCTAFSYVYFKFSLTGDKYYWLLSFVLGVTALYVHHLALLYVPCAIIAGYLLNPRLKNGLLSLFLGVAIVVCYSPWLTILPFQMFVMLGQVHYTTFFNTSVQKFLSLINPYPVGVIYSALDDNLFKIVGLCIAAAAITLVAVRIRECWANRWVRSLLIQAGLIFAIMSLSPAPVLNERNLSILLPSALLILSYGIVSLSGAKSRYLGLTFVVAFVAVSFAGFPHSNRAPDWRSALRQATYTNNAPQSTVLIIRPVWDRTTLAYYSECGLLSPEAAQMERPGYGHDDLAHVVRQIFDAEKGVEEIIVLSSRWWGTGKPNDWGKQQDFEVVETKDFMALDFCRLRRSPRTIAEHRP
jgi:uncharacterized membrane protein